MAVEVPVGQQADLGRAQAGHGHIHFPNKVRNCLMTTSISPFNDLALLSSPSIGPPWTGTS